MNANRFLPPPVRLSQAFDSENSSSGYGSSITRRSFLKRTGGATVATLVAWNLASQELKASSPESGDSESYGMLCLYPVFEASTQDYWAGTVDVPQVGGGSLPLSVWVNLATSKIVDPGGTVPYNYCGFMATGTVKASAPQSNGPKWATYWVDYVVNCDPDTGVISATANNEPWTKKVIDITVGTTDVSLTIDVLNHFEFDAEPSYPNPGHSVEIETGFNIMHSHFFNGAVVLGGFGSGTPVDNLFVAFPKSYRAPVL